MQSLRDKVVVITGAASGIGRALAVAMAAEGAKLALVDQDVAGLAETRAECASAPAVETLRVDVARREEVERRAW
jgi:NADP-dependent 3-hydroxy acid dehydrogenase YdfG